MEKQLSPDKQFLYSQLALFPEKLAGREVDKDELSHYFGTEAIDGLIRIVRGYEKSGYFKFDITLSTDYIRKMQARARRIDRADVNGPLDYIPIEKDFGLGQLYPKVEAQAPLNQTEVDYLIDNLPRRLVDECLRFRLTDINAQKFKDGLADGQAKHTANAPQQMPVPIPVGAKAAVTMAVHKATLMRRDRSLSFMIDGRHYHFRRYQTKSDSYRAFHKLYTHIGEPLTGDQLNLGPGADTAFKDIPKSMGFSGELRKQFIELGYSDTYKRPTLLMRKHVTVSKEERDRLVDAIVNRKRRIK